MRSLQVHCRDLAHCDQVVIYTCSHQRHDRQYDAVKAVYPRVRFIKEGCFQSDLLEALQDHSHVLFLVDDNVFVRSWEILQVLTVMAENDDTIGFSLRLGKNTTFCYSLNTQQQLPAFDMLSQGILKYRWLGAEADFGYPLEVSSSLYRVRDLWSLIEEGQGLGNPNLLEAHLDGSKSKYTDSLPCLMCFEQSAAFCNPVNVVQSQYANRRGGDPALAATELMRRFELGYRIDLRPFEGFIPSSCHQLVPVAYLPPRNRGRVIGAGVDITYSWRDAAIREAAEPAEGLVEIAKASCHIDLDSLGDEDRESVEYLWSLMHDACRLEVERPWLANLAKAMDEERRLYLADTAQRSLDVEKLLAWVAELRNGNEWLRDELDNANMCCHAMEEALHHAHNELEAIHNSRAYKLTMILRRLKRRVFASLLATERTSSTE